MREGDGRGDGEAAAYGETTRLTTRSDYTLDYTLDGGMMEESNKTASGTCGNGGETIGDKR